MDKETLSNYGWIVICVLVLAVMIALATPFGNFVAGAIKSTTGGFFSVNQNALNAAGVPGLTIPDQELDVPDMNHGAETPTPVVPGATFNKEKSGGSWVDLAEPVFLTWEELKLYKNGTKYGYSSSGITDTSININAFYNCKSLTSITIPDSVTSIGQQAFIYCSNLTSITIPDSVTSIGLGAFNICTGLTSVTIGNGVTSIGELAFGQCTSLTEIIVGENNQNYKSIDGVLFNKDATTLIVCPGGKSGTYQIPDGVTSIGKQAFMSCSNLTTITIPDGVTSIGEWAFDRCINLTSIIIPNSVTSIGDCAFYDTCTSLTNVYYTGTQAQWNAITIGSLNKSLTNATIHYNYVP